MLDKLATVLNELEARLIITTAGNGSTYAFKVSEAASWAHLQLVQLSSTDVAVLKEVCIGLPHCLQEASTLLGQKPVAMQLTCHLLLVETCAALGE